MAKWVPADKDPIGGNEPVGRRLFDEPVLVGAKDQPAFKGLDLRHFMETRGDEISLDRLGKTGIDKTVLKYLTPRAISAGELFQKPKVFGGWMYALAKHIEKKSADLAFALTASPVVAPEAENLYHAHATLSGMTAESDKARTQIAALQLRHVFETHGRLLGVETARRLSWRDSVQFQVQRIRAFLSR
jgi:hypothetical protein